MELVAGLYAFIGLIIWFLHHMVDKNIGTSAKDHLEFWIEVVIELALVFLWLFPPFLFVHFGLFDWIIDISGLLGFLAMCLTTVFWWALPLFSLYIVINAPVKLITRLPPIERRLCANYERATAFYKGIEDGKPKSLHEQVDLFDPPEEKVLDENGVEILPVTTPRQAKDFILALEQLRENAQAPLPEGTIQRNRSAFKRVLKKRTRAVAWRFILLVTPLTVLFWASYYFNHI